MGLLTDIKVRVATDISGFHSGMSQVKAETKEAEEQTGAFGGKMAAIAGIGALAAGAVVAFGVEAVHHSEEAGHAAFEMAEKFGLLPTQASAWVSAGEQMGVSSETVSKGFQLAAKNMEIMHLQFEQTGKVTSTQAQAFKDLGVPLVDNAGKFRDLNSIMLDVSDKFKAMPDGPEKAGLAMQLFGRSGSELIPVLNEGSAGIQDLMEKGRESGAVMSNEQVAGAQKAYLAHKQFDMAVAGVSNSLGNALMPAMAVVMTFIAGTAIPVVGRIISTIQSLHEWLIPIGAAVAVVLMPALIAWTVATWAQVVALAAQAVALIAAYWPLLLVAVIIGVVILAVMLLVKHWDIVRDKALTVWADIKNGVQQAANAVGGALGWIIQQGENFINFYLGLPGRLASIGVDMGRRLADGFRSIHIPMPHFSMSGGFDPLEWAQGRDLPSLSVNWYKAGGVFSGPSIVGVGEAGDEAVAPIDTLRDMVKPDMGAVVAALDAMPARMAAELGAQRAPAPAPARFDMHALAAALYELMREAQTGRARGARSLAV